MPVRPVRIFGRCATRTSPHGYEFQYHWDMYQYVPGYPGSSVKRVSNKETTLLLCYAYIPQTIPYDLYRQNCERACSWSVWSLSSLSEGWFRRHERWNFSFASRGRETPWLDSRARGDLHRNAGKREVNFTKCEATAKPRDFNVAECSDSDRRCVLSKTWLLYIEHKRECPF